MAKVMLVTVFFIYMATVATTTYAANNEIDLEELKSKGILPEGFNETALPSSDDVKNILKEKCIKVSGSSVAYESAEQASEVLKDCIMGLVNVEQLQKEIELAQPNGELDTVFNKYCRKRTLAIECMDNFTVAIEPCLDEKEIANKRTFVKIFTNLLNFVCHKDGDQIALFIAEKGPECFNDKKDGLIHCINSTFSSYVPSEKPTLDNLPQLVMGVQQCNDMNTLKNCVVKELEQCDESTPANLVESMFKFVRNETPCANMTATASPRNAAVSIQSTSITIISTFIMAVVARFLL